MTFKLKTPKERASEKTTVSFRIDLALFLRFQKACQQAGVTDSEGLRQLIEQLVKSK